MRFWVSFMIYQILNHPIGKSQNKKKSHNICLCSLHNFLFVSEFRIELFGSFSYRIWVGSFNKESFMQRLCIVDTWACHFHDKVSCNTFTLLVCEPITSLNQNKQDKSSPTFQLVAASVSNNNAFRMIAWLDFNQFPQNSVEADLDFRDLQHQHFNNIMSDSVFSDFQRQFFINIKADSNFSQFRSLLLHQTCCDQQHLVSFVLHLISHWSANVTKPNNSSSFDNKPSSMFELLLHQSIRYKKAFQVSTKSKKMWTCKTQMTLDDKLCPISSWLSSRAVCRIRM